MGRFEKILTNNSGLDIRDSGYYSTPKFVANYITEELLLLNPNGTRVLDPAVGNEELLERFFLEGKTIDSFDIFKHGIIKYSNFKNQDFIEYYKEKKANLFFNSNVDLEYDYYIANPPYNCHEINYIKDNKPSLNSLFNGVGTLNMYSMFLSALIDCSKEGALIGVIISDSFLTATMHAGLRQQILDNCSIHQLILCPSDLFWSQKADVRTCILILQKGRQFQRKIKMVNRPKDINQLKDILHERRFLEVNLKDLVLSPKKPSNQFIIDVEPEILTLFNHKKIGELFDCITGISTGNDTKYLSKEKKPGFDVPFYKNPGTRKFRTEPDAYLISNFIEESEKVKDFMVRNKSFVYKEGITCSSMGLPFGACYLPSNSTFGVNANIFTPREDLYWMLAYLNSYLVTYLVRGILIRSNMVTSGYISQIPVIPFSEQEKTQLSEISKNILASKLTIDSGIEMINSLIYYNMKMRNEVVLKLEDFVHNLNKRV